MNTCITKMIDMTVASNFYEVMYTVFRYHRYGYHKMIVSLCKRRLLFLSPTSHCPESAVDQTAP
jgi:hypothetical protein